MSKPVGIALRGLIRAALTFAEAQRQTPAIAKVVGILRDALHWAQKVE